MSKLYKNTDNFVKGDHFEREVKLDGADLIMSHYYDIIYNIEMDLEHIKRYVHHEYPHLHPGIGDIIYHYVKPEIIINTGLFDVPYNGGYIPIVSIDENTVLSIKSVCGFSSDIIKYKGIVTSDDMRVLFRKNRVDMGNGFYVSDGKIWKVLDGVDTKC